MLDVEIIRTYSTFANKIIALISFYLGVGGAKLYIKAYHWSRDCGLLHGLSMPNLSKK